MKTRTLESIQKFARFANIISRIAMVFCNIGAIGCAIGLGSLYFGLTQAVSVGGLTIHGLIEAKAETSIGTMYASMYTALIICIAESIVASRSAKYYKFQLEQGTPFTFEGADMLKKLGIVKIVIPLVGVILAAVAHAVCTMLYENVAELSFDEPLSIGLGIAYIFISLLCRHGAEVQQGHEAEQA